MEGAPPPTTKWRGGRRPPRHCYSNTATIAVLGSGRVDHNLAILTLAGALRIDGRIATQR